MTTPTTCEFPFCDKSSEKARSEGKPFKINRIPISRPLSDKWEIVFKFRLDERIGQHLHICSRHFDETNRRLILPTAIKKSSAKKYALNQSKTPSTAPVQKQEPPVKRKAARESLAKMQQSLRDEDDDEPQAKIKKETASDNDGDFEADDDEEDFVPPIKPSQPTVQKKRGRPRKVVAPEEPMGWWDETPAQKSQPTTVKPEIATEDKQKRSWWGDDSDSDHFGGGDEHFDDTGGVDEYDNGVDNLDNSTEPAEHVSGYIGANESVSEIDESVHIKTEVKDLDTTISDVTVRLEKIDRIYEKLYDRPIEEACEETIAYEKLRDKDRRNFGEQYDRLLEKYRSFAHQLHRVKWRNEQMVREIKIKCNKIAFLKKSFGKSYTAVVGQVSQGSED